MDFNSAPDSPVKNEKPSAKVPGWVWITLAVSLILSGVLGSVMGVFSGKLLEYTFIPDTNGAEDFSLCSVRFENFINVYDNVLQYNEIDSEYSTLGYTSTGRPYDKEKQTYVNKFNSDFAFTNTFSVLSYHQIPAILDAPSGKSKIHVSINSKIVSGNMEIRIFTLKKDFRVEETAEGLNTVKPEFLHEELKLDANNTYDFSLDVSSGYYYVIAVGAESARGNYSITAAFQ